MLNIISQNDCEMFFILIRMAIKNTNKVEITSGNLEAEKLESLYIVGGIIRWCSHYGEQFDSSSKT